MRSFDRPLRPATDGNGRLGEEMTTEIEYAAELAPALAALTMMVSLIAGGRA